MKFETELNGFVVVFSEVAGVHNWRASGMSDAAIDQRLHLGTGFKTFKDAYRDAMAATDDAKWLTANH